jgi:hypothetical protein
VDVRGVSGDVAHDRAGVLASDLERLVEELFVFAGLEGEVVEHLLDRRVDQDHLGVRILEERLHEGPRARAVEVLVGRVGVPADLLRVEIREIDVAPGLVALVGLEPSAALGREVADDDFVAVRVLGVHLLDRARDRVDGLLRAVGRGALGERPLVALGHLDAV